MIDPAGAYTIEQVLGTPAPGDVSWTLALQQIGKGAASLTRDAGLEPGYAVVYGRSYSTVGVYPGWAITWAIREWLDRRRSREMVRQRPAGYSW